MALLRDVLVGTVGGDMRIRFDPEIFPKLLVNRGDLMLRCGDRILAKKPRRILDASARGVGQAEGDQHHRRPRGLSGASEPEGCCAPLMGGASRTVRGLTTVRTVHTTPRGRVLDV